MICFGSHGSNAKAPVFLCLFCWMERLERNRKGPSGCVPDGKEEIMQNHRRMSRFGRIALCVLVAVMALTVCVFAEGELTTGAAYVSPYFQSIWSLLPPVVAIGLALITKEVYSSLFVGILVGGLLYTNFQFAATMEHVFKFGMIESALANKGNAGILLFLVLLGAMVALMNKAGGSAAFGRWAATHIKSRVGAQIATVALGGLIFIDDYFNCLTVGSVMRPVTDSHKVSRAKLAYIIDATAAPVCIIAPISSWAAAVTGFVDGVNGLDLFIRAIPYNFYAFLTIVMLLTLAMGRFDYGPMALHEANARLNGDLFSDPNRAAAADEEAPNPKGRVRDLIVPIAILIVCCVAGMLYTGGFFSGVNFVDAFANSVASTGLVYGSAFAFVFTVVFYMCRRILNFRDCMDCLPEGFKAMVPAIMILTLAWTLKAMTDSLGAREFVGALVKSSAGAMLNLLPAIVFLIAVFLAFATGTSWGTFGILIPIVTYAFEYNMNNEMMIIAISACMAGAVAGDHCSPISDTTIMASAGAQCNHMSHVSTQLPYALTVAGVSFVCYLIAGLVRNAWVMLPLSILLMVGTLLVIRAVVRSKENA